MSRIKPSLLGMVLGLSSVSVAFSQDCKQAADQTPREVKVVEGSAPSELCARFDEATAASLHRGSARLVLVLTEFRPPVKGTGSLVVKSAGREQVFGILPQTRFDRTDLDSHQRFYVGRPDEKLELEPDGSICVNVGLRSEDGSGSARLHLETWQPAVETQSQGS